MLEIVKVKEIHIFSINVDEILEEENEVLERDDELVLTLLFQNTSSRILIDNRIVNYFLISSD